MIKPQLSASPSIRNSIKTIFKHICTSHSITSLVFSSIYDLAKPNINSEESLPSPTLNAKASLFSKEEEKYVQLLKPAFSVLKDFLEKEKDYATKYRIKGDLVA